MSKVTVENQYLVFDVREGTKVIIEQLNAFGADGWKLAAMLNVGETQLVGFLTKENRKDAPDPKQSEADKIASIWTASNKDDE